MRQFTTTTTQRNQVTIPSEVRRLLGIKPRDKVSFTIENDGHVRISAAEFTLETAYRSVKSLRDGRDIDEIIRDVKEEKSGADYEEDERSREVSGYECNHQIPDRRR